MDREIALLITGAAIGLGSSTATAVVQHILILRRDKVIRERDEKERKRDEEKRNWERLKKIGSTIKKLKDDLSSSPNVWDEQQSILSSLEELEREELELEQQLGLDGKNEEPDV